MRYLRGKSCNELTETAFLAIKRTLGHHLTSIRRDHQKLELMIKVIVYNITVLIKKSAKRSLETEPKIALIGPERVLQ